jgi:sugar-specific transcriptional regulator TrmB
LFVDNKLASIYNIAVVPFGNTRMENKINLEALGLTKRESLVYLALLKNGSLSPTEIANKTGLKRSNIYDVVKSLERKGLIHYQLKPQGKLIVASSPNNLVNLSKQQYAYAQKILPTLLSLDKEQSFQSSVTFYQGRRGMREMVKDYPKAKNKDVIFLTSPKDMNEVLGESFVESLIQERIKRGTKMRTLETADSNFKWKGHMTEAGRKLTEIAYVPPKYTFTLDFGVYDDVTVFFSSKKEGLGFKVESKELAQVMRMLFDNLWENSGKLTAPQ